jgi:hypothetical protein
MDLHDYPRPKGDTGIGVHWSAGYPAVVGIGQIRDFWLPEIQAMGVKWVKLAQYDGGLEVSELLLKHDIMPIVRLYRAQPNPGTLDGKALAAVKDYVAVGVRYFEFNNEPDMPVEWQGDFMPPDAIEVVACNAIIDIEAILAAGGYPAIPALTVGSKWDLVGEICRQGRRDLFSEPVWQSIHNYSINHPLDYPYDAGNQSGAPYTQEFYDRLAAERWDGNAWSGWSLERVNAERRDHANPGATTFDDPLCWRAHERYDKLIRDQIGRSLPILGTENGYIVDERPDPRYPNTTPRLHAAQTLEICRIMMGTSSRFDHAPDYYFCTAFWLLGNYSLGNWSPDWESQAWYSGRWPGGHLPVVEALKAEPKQVRLWRGDVGLVGRVSGTVRGGAGLAVQPTQAVGWSVTAQVGANERYEISDMPLDSYRVVLTEADRSQELTLTRERPAATANLDLTGVPIEPEASVVRGKVQGGAGQTVRLSRAGNWSQEQALATDGSYRFTGLAAGSYAVTLGNTGVSQTGIILDGHNELMVDLAAPGWGWEVTDGGSGPGFGVVRCRVTGRSDVPVHLWTEGWEGMTQRTGSKTEFGTDACEFAPLGVGRYLLQIDRTDIVAEVIADGRRVHWVTFTEHVSPPPQKGAIAGRVTNGDGRIISLLRPPTAEPAAQVQAAEDGSYHFNKLAAGAYTVQVLEGASGSTVVVEQADVVVDGSSEVLVDLALSQPQPEPQPQPESTAGLRWSVEDGGEQPGPSVVRCRVIGGAGRAVSLWTWGWGGITQVAGSKPEYGPDACEFSPLGAGLYFLELEEPAADGSPAQTVRAEVNLAANRVAWVRFEPAKSDQPQEPTISQPGRGDLPTAPAAPIPSAVPDEPVTGVITGSVIDGKGKLLLLAGPMGELQATVTDGRYRFEGLPAGAYRIAVMADDSALGELAVGEGVVADGQGELVIDLALPALVRFESSVTGRVRGGAGRGVTLEWLLPGVGGDTVESHNTVVAADETYSFTGLGAGAYRAILRDTDPPTGGTQTQAGIMLDGTPEGGARVDFDLTALGPGKLLDHYLMVGGVARTKDDYLTILRYAARFRPSVGSDETEARQARHVTILGGPSSVSALTEQGLRMSGCQVQRIDGDYTEKLGKLLDAGRAY